MFLTLKYSFPPLFLLCGFKKKKKHQTSLDPDEIQNFLIRVYKVRIRDASGILRTEEKIPKEGEHKQYTLTLDTPLLS